jgi:hypothetical protein
MVFGDGGFAYVVFSFLKIKACISHLLILDEIFIVLDKNPLGFFKHEYTKKLGGFTQISILVKVD